MKHQTSVLENLLDLTTVRFDSDQLFGLGAIIFFAVMAGTIAGKLIGGK
jgi:hypothetical protein